MYIVQFTLHSTHLELYYCHVHQKLIYNFHASVILVGAVRQSPHGARVVFARVVFVPNVAYYVVTQVRYKITKLSGNTITGS